VFEDIEEAKDGTEHGIRKRGMIEIAAQSPAESLDTSGGPVGEIGEGAIFDFAVLAEGFAEEDGGGRGTVGYGGDVDTCRLAQTKHMPSTNCTLT
jgi:hypothetical protein